MYFRARMYSDKLGRFVSRDPAGYVDGYALYNGYYVPNDTDPTGLFIWGSWTEMDIDTAWNTVVKAAIRKEIEGKSPPNPNAAWDKVPKKDTCVSWDTSSCKTTDETTGLVDLGTINVSAQGTIKKYFKTYWYLLSGGVAIKMELKYKLTKCCCNDDKATKIKDVVGDGGSYKRLYSGNWALGTGSINWDEVASVIPWGTLIGMAGED